MSQKNSVWTKDEIERQIRRLENQLDVVRKRPSSDKAKVDDARRQLEAALDSFSEDKFLTAEKSLMDVKHKLIDILGGLNFWERLVYFISVWAVVPLLYAVAGLLLSFYFLTRSSGITIMGVVPLWASLMAALGASVQILVGVVKDYRDDGIVTGYKRLWYLIVIPASLAFGFVAFLLIQGGLITVSQGTFVINPANQTVTRTGTSQTATAGAANQTTASTAYGLALPLILCFLAGYATDWFMGLLGRLIQQTESGKK